MEKCVRSVEEPSPDAKQREVHTALCAGVVGEALSAALSDVASLRVKLKLARVLLRDVLSGADVLTNKKWMRAAEQLTEDV